MLFGLVFTVSADPDQPEVDPVAHAITVTTENGTATASAETAIAGTEISPLQQKPTRASASRSGRS